VFLDFYLLIIFPLTKFNKCGFFISVMIHEISRRVIFRLCNGKALADHPVGDLVIKKSKAVPGLGGPRFLLSIFKLCNDKSLRIKKSEDFC